MLLRHFYQSILSGYNVILFNNPSQSGLWIGQSKVSQEGINMYYFDFLFHADRYKNNKETNGKPFVVRYNNSRGVKKMTKTRNGKNQLF